MKKSFITKLSFITVAMLVVSASPVWAAKVTEHIAVTVKGIDIPITILTPDSGLGPFPVIYHVHGGGWNGGTESMVPPAGLPPESGLLCDELGLVYVGLAYRCKLQGNFQEAMEDLRASIKWFESRAGEFHADTSRVGLSGGSAGTPLSSLLAQEMPDCKTYVGLFGVYDFVSNEESLFPDEEACATYGLSGKRQKLEASAFHNLRPAPPATLLFHGKKDILTHHSQSLRFVDELKKRGCDAEAILYPDVNHGYFNPRYPVEFKDTTLRIAKLYAEHLKLDTSGVDQLGERIDTMVAGFFPLDEIKPEIVLGQWQGKNEQIIFEGDNNGSITTPNGKNRSFSYEIGPGVIMLHEPDGDTTFYMQRDQRAIYTIVENDVRRSGQRFHYVDRK